MFCHFVWVCSVFAVCGAATIAVPRFPLLSERYCCCLVDSLLIRAIKLQSSAEMAIVCGRLVAADYVRILPASQPTLVADAFS